MVTRRKLHCDLGVSKPVYKGYQEPYLDWQSHCLTTHKPMLAKQAIPTAPNLNHRAPRSPRCRLGGYVILPRMLDKCRAHLAGTLGEYHFNCPLDQQFLTFVGIDADALEAELATGRTDSEMLAWIGTHVQHPRAAWEIESWSANQERRAPTSDPDTSAFFAALLARISTTRTDIHSWADLIELDDHVSFGGTA